jgi:hypothetical protein
MQSSVSRRLFLGSAAVLFGTQADAGNANGDAVCPELIGKLARIIRPGDMVTQDYSPERVNIVLDEESQIVEIRFG